jgi:hypothetical protein
MTVAHTLRDTFNSIHRQANGSLLARFVEQVPQ